MDVLVRNIDLLDQLADALIYSTNVLLNCTGGVGACLLERYGKQVQTDLHKLLSDQGIRFAEQGAVIQHVTEGMPYKQVFHTVPCDGFYETTEEIVSGILRYCLKQCAEVENIHTVAMSALATGYGRLLYDDFFRIASTVFSEEDYAGIDSVTICVSNDYSYRLVKEQAAEEKLPLTLV